MFKDQVHLFHLCQEKQKYIALVGMFTGGSQGAKEGHLYYVDDWQRGIDFFC